MHPQKERERQRVTMREDTRKAEQTNNTHLLLKHKTELNMIHTLLRPDDTHAMNHVTHSWCRDHVTEAHTGNAHHDQPELTGLQAEHRTTFPIMPLQ